MSRPVDPPMCICRGTTMSGALAADGRKTGGTDGRFCTLVLLAHVSFSRMIQQHLDLIGLEEKHAQLRRNFLAKGQCGDFTNQQISDGLRCSGKNLPEDQLPIRIGLGWQEQPAHNHSDYRQFRSHGHQVLFQSHQQLQRFLKIKACFRNMHHSEFTRHGLSGARFLAPFGGTPAAFLLRLRIRQNAPVGLHGLLVAADVSSEFFFQRR